MEESRTITRKSASNLALAFIMLPKAKRDAMSALYAFCRQVDDVADEESVPVGERRRALSEWREDIQRACGAETPRFPVNGELQTVIRQFQLPYELFDELIRGVEMDLDITRYENYDTLDLYCYRVASVVGLLSIEIFGYKNPGCRDYAIYLGKALQLTNILRDVGCDAARGRIYLPVAELASHQVSQEEILQGQYSERFVGLATSVAQRARHFYHLAGKALPADDRASMLAAELMGTVYWRLLRKLESNRFPVLGPQPTRLSKAHKLMLIGSTWFRFALGSAVPGYGR
jgi:15-cis-phytoene synthase